MKMKMTWKWYFGFRRNTVYILELGQNQPSCNSIGLILAKFWHVMFSMSLRQRLIIQLHKQGRILKKETECILAALKLWYHDVKDLHSYFRKLMRLWWTITHCLGLGHETMVCAVCLSIFLWSKYTNYTCLDMVFRKKTISKICHDSLHIGILSNFDSTMETCNMRLSLCKLSIYVFIV